MDLQLIVESAVLTPKLPAPSQVEVREKLGDTTTYTISFSEDICNNQFMNLQHPAFNPLVSLSVFVKVGDKKLLLVEGPVQKHQISLLHGGQGSKLQVSGSDNSVRMGWNTRTKNWGKKITRSEVETILKDYDFQKKNVIVDEADKKNNSSGSSHTSDHHSLKNGQVQREADLSFLKKQAAQVSAYFWMSYENNQETANFAPLPLDSTDIKHTLIINFPDNNVDELSINWDANRPTSVESQEVAIDSKKTKDGDEKEPTQKKLGDITLKELTANASTALITKPGDDSGKIKDRSKSALNDAEWFIHLTCSVNFEKFCDDKELFHAHTKVKLRGAGARYDGEYIVSGVTHTIDAVSYKLQLELMRNAWNKTTETIK